MLKTITAVIIALHWTAAAFAVSDEDSIRQLLHGTFDRPDSRLVVDPVVVAGSHATLACRRPLWAAVHYFEAVMARGR